MAAANNSAVQRIQKAVGRLTNNNTNGAAPGTGGGGGGGGKGDAGDAPLSAAAVGGLVGKSGRQLRGYQMEGVNWALSVVRRRKGSGGILADEMGLGKTIQTVAVLSALKKSSATAPTSAAALRAGGAGVAGPHYLVLAPLSVLQDWVKEVERHSANLRCVMYSGDKDTREELRGLLRKDRGAWDGKSLRAR